MVTCLDKDLIHEWIISDDGSCEEDIKVMQAEFPLLNITRSPGHGQAISLNYLFSLVKTQWIFHMEDDWLFLERGNYIRKMFDITNDKIKNVVLRKWKPYDILSQKDGFVLHKHVPEEQDWDIISTTDCGWYGYSLNPGIQDLDLIKSFGKFDETCKVESRRWDKEIARKYNEAGYLRASLSDKKYIEHIGNRSSLYSLLRKECAERHGCTDFRECEVCTKNG